MLKLLSRFCLGLFCLTLAAPSIANDANLIADKPTNSSQDSNPMTTVSLQTNHGEIQIQLDAEKAPLTVANFLSYVADKHYDGTVFHRVIPGFMLQGGGFAPGMQQKPTKPAVVNEANNGLTNDLYTVAMARTNDPHSATAQFFINVKDNDFLNFSSETSRGWGYTVFGKVITGEDIVKKIETVTTGRSGAHGDVPLEDVLIESVSIVE
jgi:peptidyl-prolyl cis-trans isomerase B (cyclophilin B)